MLQTVRMDGTEPIHDLSRHGLQFGSGVPLGNVGCQRPSVNIFLHDARAVRRFVQKGMDIGKTGIVNPLDSLILALEQQAVSPFVCISRLETLQDIGFALVGTLDDTVNALGRQLYTFGCGEIQCCHLFS